MTTHRPAFEYYRSGVLRRWRWRLLAGNGEILASGQAFRTRRACLASVELVQTLAPGAAVREVER